MQNLENFEAMAAVTLQFLTHDAQYQAGLTATPNSRRGPDDMEIDALTSKGKGHKGKRKLSKTEGTKTRCSVRGRLGHMSKDCWFKETNQRTNRNNFQPTNKGKTGKGKGKNSVNEITTPTESVMTQSTAPSVETLARQIWRVATWDRPASMDEDKDEEYETGSVCASIRHREPFHRSKDWFVVHVLVGNCPDRHVCSPRDYEWTATEPSRNPHLVSASGHILKRDGEQSLPMELRD